MSRSLLPLALVGVIAFIPAISAAETVGDAVTANAPAASTQRTSAMQIRFTVDGKTLTATLLDNATTKDLLSLLPVTLTLEDYAATEKIAYLPRKLSTTDAPAGTDPAIGDLAYYAPWGNLAIFYQEASYAPGLIKLGHLDANVDALKVSGSVKVTLESVR